MHRRRVIPLLGALSIAAFSFASSATELPKVAFVAQLIGVPYFNAMEAGGKRAGKDLDVDFIYTGPVDNNPVDQLQLVQNLINQGVQSIAVGVIDQSATAPVIASAKARGLHIFTTDSDAADSERDLFVAQADDRALANTLLDKLVGEVGDDARIGLVSADPTSANLNVWMKLMRERAAEKYPKLQLFDPVFAGGTSDRAAQLANDLIVAHPEMKAIVAMAASTCPGVGQAIESSGKIGQITAAGYCTPNSVKSYVKSGAISFSVLWDPEALGYLTVWAGKQLLQGKPFEASNSIAGLKNPATYDDKKKVLLLGDPTVFTKDNIDQFDF